MNDALRERVKAIAAAPVLLVASDYDGTISPLVEDPARAMPSPRALAALRALSTLDHTHALILSGRSRSDLARFCGDDHHLRLVGSHGAEDAEGHCPESPRELLAILARDLDEIAAVGEGLKVEHKPLAAALHYRAASDALAQRALIAVLEGPARTPGVIVRHGSKVIELCVTSADKGSALAAERFHAGATAALFIGDDLTDEDVFTTLSHADLGIKVGEGPTAALHRIPDVADVEEVLEALLALRRAWLNGRNLDPLESFSILSDQRTVCVVDRRGSIVWQCLPRIDSAALFASILGGDPAGLFSIHPVGQELPIEQVYDGDSLILRTQWQGITTTDYFDTSTGRAFQRAGRTDLIRVIEGQGRVRLRFSPRIDFGRVHTHLKPLEGGLEVEGSPDPIVLFSGSIRWTIKDDGPHHTAEADVELNGAPIILELRYGSGSLRESIVPEPERRAQTKRFWSGWASVLKLPTLHSDAVKRSALTLKALCHGPSGSFAAAATTSLPEHLGGVRNWDYRFCWPRDASLSAAALVRLGNTGHAMKLLDWLLGVVDSCESPDRLRPIYTVTGHHLPPEAEISHLSGFADSKPVRLSNAAAHQVQLDVFGPIVDLVALLAERGAPISPDHWRLVRAMVQAVEARWKEPDHGIWEIRASRRHHVHSKVMCWLTVHRALIVQDLVFGRREAAWERLADEIKSDVLSNGWNETIGSFTAAYGSSTIDAATLWIGLSGLIAPGDPRFIATVDAVNRTLRAGPTVFRYKEPDGLPGVEGGMLICAGWLAESFHLVGRHEDARALLNDLVALLGPTGIAPEQYCPRHKIALGNIAQAYSHLAIINAAVALSSPTSR